MQRKSGMVDVGGKKDTVRCATAYGFIETGEIIVQRIKDQNIAKGDVLTYARISGITAAKKTSELIPLCHQISLDSVAIDCELCSSGIAVYASAKARAKTGVEMEALTACMASALTIYDMCKMYSHDIEIKHVYLLEKKGGKTGVYRRKKRV